MKVKPAKKQKGFMDQFEANQADPDLWGDRKEIKLFHGCGNWKTVLISINSIFQKMSCL
jgi:hypothetical protein